MSDQATVPRKPNLLAVAARLGAHAMWDSLARPEAKKIDEVPRRIEAVTLEWLTAVLCKDALNARVVDHQFGPLTTGTTVRRQIRLKYEGNPGNADLPASVFAKSTPTFLNRMLHSLTATMESEAKFYRHIRPLLALEAPRGYHSAYDLNTGRAIHLLEDLVATKGATFCETTTYVSRERAEDVVGVLAALHGRFFDDPGLAPRFPWVKTYPTWFREGFEGFKLQPYHEKAMVEAAEVIPPEIQKRRAEIWPAQLRSLVLHERRPQTLIHGDVHLGNWYVTKDGRMGLCDWQCTAIGTWARDFAYAITATLTVEDRRKWDRELLALYLDKIHQATGRKIDFDQAWLLYRQQVISALLMWTPTLCHSPLMPDMQPRGICFEMIKRMTTAMVDLDSLASLKAV